jgi:malto-oligosyltrehalose synthase
VNVEPVAERLLQHRNVGDLSEQPLGALWQRVSGRPGDFAAEEALARRQILARSFSAQLGALVQTLRDIAARDLATRDYTAAAIRRVLVELLSHFPVYRIYAGVERASESDRAFLSRAVAGAMSTCLAGDAWLVERLGAWLSGSRIRADLDALQGVALARFQQLSAPLCAKAVEDTAFYRYGRLLSRNDVGFDASRFALPVAEFHARMQARARDLPHAMLATATHDHKRGEDVRARLAVLSEIPDEWSRHVERWLQYSTARCEIAGAGPMPMAGDLAMLFQTIVGSWPMQLKTDDRAALAAFSKRIIAWQEKALREAKLHSDWSAPNETYEGAARRFIEWLFGGESPLLGEIAAFAHRIAPAGAANGLAQVLLKLTAPGVPDIYQGTEYWDLSLVDPDNRAPVDFAARQKSLAATAEEAAAHWTDGHIKQLVVRRVLAVRKQMPDVFSNGPYLPLQAAGELADHVVAWARHADGAAVIGVFVRHSAGLSRGDSGLSIPAAHWKDTRILVPANLRGVFSNALMPQPAATDGAHFCVAQMLHALPVAFLVKQPG